MKPIFEPKGRAREFSPLAMNIWQGCDHDCVYCFNKRKNGEFGSLAQPIPNVIESLKKQLSQEVPRKQVLITFSGDPYCRAEMEHNLTRQVLEILNIYDIPVALLSKGGKRCLKDLELFKKFKAIKIGATMVISRERDRKIWEPLAAPTAERMETLRICKSEGLQTWASIEPVIYPDQAIEIIEKTHTFVDGYKISKLNYHPVAKLTDWKAFTEQIVKLLRELKKSFYIKDDLAELFPDSFFKGNERNKDAMALGER